MRNLIIFVLMAAFTVSASHARNFKYVYKDVTFKLNEEKGGLTVTSFDDDADVVVIPGKVDGMPVKRVSCFLNGHNYMASEIIIEEGVEEIAKFCFNEFRNLSKVTVPSSLTKVNSNAFRKNNGIVFYGPESFNFALVSGYTSRPFNGQVAVTNEKLLAQHVEPAPDQNNSWAEAKETKFSKPKKQKDVEKAEGKQKEEKHKKGGSLFSKLTKAVGFKGDDVQAAVAAATPAKQEVVATQSVAVPEPAVKKRKLSDVDINIPRSKKTNESTFCFIIANEKYDELPTVNYAENDGKTFKEYCVNALGVPESQVFLYVNASFTSMTRAIRKMESLAAATNGKSKFVFYYAGHGSPSEEDQTAHIVPSDGLVTVPSTCFSLGDLYKRFGVMPAESVVVLLDACFSGLNRDNSGLIAARAVARKPKKETITGNVIVLSATSEAETAMGYDEKEHGMFTYHVLKKLQQSNGDVKFSDLYNAVSAGVRRDAIIKNDKNQTPSIAVSSSLKTSWENMSF